MQINQADSVNPLQGLVSGLQSGMNTGMQFQQMAMQRRNEEWNQDFRNANMLMQAANLGGIDNDKRAELLTKGFQVMSKWYPEYKGIVVPPERVNDFGEILKNRELLEGHVRKGILTPDAAASQMHLQIGKALANMQELNDRERLLISEVGKPFGENQEQQAVKRENLAQRINQGESQMRGQFIQESRPFKSIAESYARIEDAVKTPTPAGDLSLIYNYMKILDPTSVVRESEFAQAAATGAYGERIKAAVNRVVNGKRLSDEIRKDFVFQAQQLYSGQEKLHGQREEQFRSLALEQGYNPRAIVFEMRALKNGMKAGEQSKQSATESPTQTVPKFKILSVK